MEAQISRMEVAGQWRRQWAGTAEYGKVTEGGVTRQVARAMEVLHASTPGTRVRVMRAAYHSSAGPGAPASSFLMHSSRRVISSGFNFLESPTSPTKPLEISSTPLETSQDINSDTENYKVTEPDDSEISEPSKWRGSTSGASTIRMPSEESSSTDNASLIDLDPKPSHNNITRKYSYDSESSDVPPGKRNSFRASPLIDTPVTLNTLKYKYLLNNSNDWNSRRKSYSFEDTSPLNETILHNNATLAMESSTDSGICKSSEIMHEPTDDRSNYYESRTKRDETFGEWLNKNRTSPIYKGNHFKSSREQHNVINLNQISHNIAVQSAGKVSITVPMTLETDEEYIKRKSQYNDDNDRKSKRVEFCKTELHFAAESGRVKIIATDEKPPPSNDFKKRRSAFVPLDIKIDKPITLFGEKCNDLNELSITSVRRTGKYSEISELDENTAATKSILKNKIPKPKPYLLGENMALGFYDDSNDCLSNSSTPSAVSLINKQLEEDKRYNDALVETEQNSTINHNTFRTNKKSPSTESKPEKYGTYEDSTSRFDRREIITDKLKNMQMSPSQVRAKTRKLRGNEITYFGLSNNENNSRYHSPKSLKNLTSLNNNPDEIFNSVRLVQQISSSVSNSEAESEEIPKYQNLPIKTNLAPIPIPRTRTKHIQNSIDHDQITSKPIIQQDNGEIRKPRPRRREEVVAKATNRSLSEPSRSKEKYRYNIVEKPPRRHETLLNTTLESSTPRESSITDKERPPVTRCLKEDDSQLYANLDDRKNISVKEDSNRKERNRKKSHTETLEKHVERPKIEKANDTKNRSRSRQQSSSKDFVQKVHHNFGRTKHDENRSITKEKHENRSRSSHGTSDKPSKEIKIDENCANNVEDINASHRKAHNTNSNPRSRHLTRSKDMQNGSLKHVDRKIKTGDIDSTASDRQSKYKRNEYVINYDDKNGTVSSICKIKPGSVTSSKKKYTEEKVAYPKEYKHRSKSSDAKYLLQLPELQRDLNEKVWMKKRFAQRACQLL